MTFWCQLLLGMTIVTFGESNEEIPTELSNLDVGWRAVNRCGPNSLYVMLFMHGLKPDYNRLVSSMSITERGANIEDLVRAAEENGLPLIALKTNVKDLVTFSTPALLHYQPPGELGHYAVLLRANPDNTFTILETTRGRVEVQAKGDFLNQWSGVALVRKSDWAACQFDKMLTPCSWVASIAMLANLAWLVWGLLYSWLIKTRRRSLSVCL